MTFKVGDRVRRLNYDNEDVVTHRVGDIGVVTKLGSRGNLHDADGLYVDGMWWDQENTELADQALHSLPDCLMALDLAEILLKHSDKTTDEDDYWPCVDISIWLQTKVHKRLRELVAEADGL